MKEEEGKEHDEQEEGANGGSVCAPGRLSRALSTCCVAVLNMQNAFATVYTTRVPNRLLLQ